MMKRIVFIFVLASLLPALALAEIKLNLQYPEFGGFDLNVQQNLPQIIAFFYYFMVTIAGLAAFVMLIWGGVQWLSSAGNASQISDAKDKIQKALLGLLLILGSFLVIQILNPELTVISSEPLDAGERAAPLYGNVASDGTTSATLPTGATKDGVYLCREAQCKCRKPANCNQGADPDTATGHNDDPTRPADYLFLDPTVLTPFTKADDGVGINNLNGTHTVAPGKTLDLDWNDKVKSVAIKGDYGVLLADDPDYKGVATCFDNRSGGNLHEFERIRDALEPKKPFKRWDENGAQSAKILKGGLCRAPGITLAEETHFWKGGDVVGPTVYFFEVLEQGKNEDAQLRYKVPVAYCFDLSFCAGPTNAASDPGPAVSEAPSLYLVPGAEFAVRLYQSSPPTTSLSMCFQGSVDNLRLYTWDLSDPKKVVSEAIEHIWGITDAECPESGKPTPP